MHPHSRSASPLLPEYVSLQTKSSLTDHPRDVNFASHFFSHCSIAGFVQEMKTKREHKVLSFTSSFVFHCPFSIHRIFSTAQFVPQWSPPPEGIHIFDEFLRFFREEQRMHTFPSLFSARNVNLKCLLTILRD